MKAFAIKIGFLALAIALLIKTPSQPNSIDIVASEAVPIPASIITGIFDCLIIKQSKVPVIVDAGIGTASDATIAMELGCDGVLINSAISNSKKPILMAKAFKDAVISGRNSYLAGRMNKSNLAIPSSTNKGII